MTVKFSKPIITAGNANSIFIFSGSMFSSTGPQSLSTLQLSTLGGAVDKLDITISAKRGPTGGNGTVDLNGINASNVDPNTGDVRGIEANQIAMAKIGSVTYLPSDPLLSFSAGVQFSPRTADM